MLRGNPPPPPNIPFFLLLSISFPSLFKKKSENFGGGLNPLNPSLKYALEYLSTIPDTPCIANYDNSLENSSHTNPHLLTGVHPV